MSQKLEEVNKLFPCVFMREFLKYFLMKVSKYTWIFILIFCIGIFFRVYHFGDWLQFKGDAFRDAILISNVYDTGVASLPLLGPRAGGTMLRLGPVFYDFQYIATQIFQSVDTVVLAYPDLFFSILTLPLFFFFVRRYFSQGWSLLLMLFLAVSFLAIEYGRFAWNPNSVLFFTLIFSFAVLSLYEKKEGGHQLLWASVAGLSLAIASQLHFSAFLGLPIVLLLFIVWNVKQSKQVLTFRVVSIFFLCLGIVYLPVFISEFFKHGENARLFLSAISSKSSSNGLLLNIYQDLHMFAKYFARILIGLVEPSKWIILLGGLFCGLGLLANAFLLRSETDEKKQHFLKWSLLLIVVYFFLYIPLAFKIDRPRFYLPFMVVPFLYFGYMCRALDKKGWFVKYRIFLFSLGIIIIAGSNVIATLGWFSELRNSQETATSTGERNSKGRSYFLTWGHFERTAEVIERSCEKENNIYFQMAKNIKAYDHSIEYALLMKKRSWESTLQSTEQTMQGGCYYYISFVKEVLPDYLLTTKRDTPVDVGNLNIVRVYPEGEALEKFRERKITVERMQEQKIFEPEKITRYSRVFWGDVWYRLNK